MATLCWACGARASRWRCTNWKARGLIKGTRNRITVVDREGLLGLANGFYGVPEAEYDRTIRPRRAPGRG